MKPLLAVFAHPDDEAFGPAGTIALEAKRRDVYLICVTNGAAGKNSSRSKKNLSEIRKKELINSAKILGIKKVFCLNYEDGSLCNNFYHEISEKIESKIKKLQPETVITFEPHGVTGHIDHVTVNLVTTFVVNKIKTIKNLYYYCILESERRRQPNDYFIYFPDGYKQRDIGWKNDISKVWDIKVKAIRAHKSQKHDADIILPALEKLPKYECFLVKNK